MKNKMKKYITIIIILTSVVSFGQEQEKKIRSNEIKLNVFNALIFKSFDLTYEYLINDESAAGLSFMVNLNDDFSDGPDYNEEYAITPYYRHYFSSKYAMGFFIEAFGMFNKQEIDEYYYYDDYFQEPEIIQESSNNFALGFSLGGKFVSSKGFVFEFFGGIGRNLFTSSDFNSTEFVPRLGISLGYRF
jgi:hypothetical protein